MLYWYVNNYYNYYVDGRFHNKTLQPQCKHRSSAVECRILPLTPTTDPRRCSYGEEGVMFFSCLFLINGTVWVNGVKGPHTPCLLIYGSTFVDLGVYEISPPLPPLLRA